MVRFKRKIDKYNEIQNITVASIFREMDNNVFLVEYTMYLGCWVNITIIMQGHIHF